MDQRESIKNLAHIASQIPNPYTVDQWYDVTFLNGKAAQAKYTKPGYLRIRRIEKHVLKSPDGEILSQHMAYTYYRANLKTGAIKLL